MTKEIWKDIKGYEGLYQVSNLGRVKSLNYKRQGIEKNLKTNFNKQGYLYVDLYKCQKTKKFRIHQLVANAFIPKLERLTQINHKNGIKTDNRVCNLEWVTPSENVKHAYKHGLRNISEKQKQRFSNLGKASRKKVLQYDLQGNFIKEWDSMKEAEKRLNIWYTNISNCCRGIYKTAGGYVWKYK